MTTQYPEPEEFEVDSDVATRRARYLCRTINQFWQRWRKEYLVGLREMHCCQIKRRSHAPKISVGDVVIIHNDQPRAMWKLGIVEELLVGADGESRAAVLRVSGQKRLQRPVQRLYPIEMAVKTPENLSESEPNTTTEQNHELNCEPPVRRQLRRAAALKARDRIAAQALDSDEEDDD